jgi:hypothetical protein
MNKRKGRPIKYFDEDTKIEIRRYQNRMNQRRHRTIKKIKSEIETAEKSKIWNIQYRDNIVKYFNQFDFDFFFTGTVKSSEIDKLELNNTNLEIKKINESLNADIPYKVKKKIGLNGLATYTKKYIDNLFTNNIIIRCFYVIEEGENHNYHVHMLMKSQNNIIDFIENTERRWILGKSSTVPFLGEQDKLNLLNYCAKELEPSSKQEKDRLKIDNWYFEGEFWNKNTLPTIQTVGQIN